MTRILIVDDHELMRWGLENLISQEPDLEVCGHAETEEDAWRLVCQNQPEVVVTDIKLREGNGLNLVRRIRDGFPFVRQIVLSMYSGEMFAEHALAAGAVGYMEKQQSSQTIIQAVRTILAGEVYLDPALTQRMLRRRANPGESPLRSPSDVLSDRELAVFRLIGEAKGTREIAQALGVSVSTVETYQRRIKTKLDLHDSAELTRRAMEWSLCAPRPSSERAP